MNKAKSPLRRLLSLMLALAAVAGLFTSALSINAFAAPVSIVEWRYNGGPFIYADPATGGVLTEGSAFTNSQGIAPLMNLADGVASSPGLQQWNAQSSSNVNNAYWQFSFSTKGYKDLAFSAQQQ